MRGLLEATPKHSYKFVVNSTIVQHDIRNQTRGLHSATGSFWDMNQDGQWSFKLDGLDKREFDVVVTIIWIAVEG